LAQHISGPGLFLSVYQIRWRLGPAAKRETLNVEPQPLQRQDFAANERVADFRVLIDEIRDFQDRIQRDAPTTPWIIVELQAPG